MDYTCKHIHLFIDQKCSVFLSCRSMFCFLKFHSCLHKVVLCVTVPCRNCRYVESVANCMEWYMYCNSADDLLYGKGTGQTLCLCSTAQFMSSHSAIQNFRGAKATCIENMYHEARCLPLTSSNFNVCIFYLCACFLLYFK